MSRGIIDAQSDPELLGNAELMERCRKLGTISIKSRRMFIGLLPLVARRKAYDIRKFSSIHHFALVIGGVGYHLVDEVLRLDAQLKYLPLLRRELYRGEIGWAKIRLVISSVKEDDQQRWLDLLYALSKPALEVYLRDIRKQNYEENNLFSDMIEVVSHASCASEEYSTQSPLSPKGAIFEAESFPGKTFESGNENDINQLQSGKIGPEKNQPQQTLTKQQELSSRRENFSCNINQWLGAQLRLFRKKMEKERKKWTTWEDVLAELLGKVELIAESLWLTQLLLLYSKSKISHFL